MSVNIVFAIDKEKLDAYFKELGKLLRKRMKGNVLPCELVVVGGASIILNYGFRQSTIDVDCADTNGVLMNEIVNEVAEKYNLPTNWINTDFVNTKSYSDKLIQYSAFYKSYGNGALSIRTVKDEYLVAMKIVSARRYKNDYSDIFGIIDECREKDKPLDMSLIEKAIVDLYGSLDFADETALLITKKIIDNDSNLSYSNISNNEKANVEIIKTKKYIKNQRELDYLLNQLDEAILINTALKEVKEGKVKGGDKAPKEIGNKYKH